MDPVAGGIARAGLALLFAVAALHKLADRRAFESTLAAYRVLPEGLERLAVSLLIALEVGTAVALLGASSALFGGAAAAGLLVAYSAAIALNLARGRRDIDCGCLGPRSSQPLSGWLLARNAVLAAAAGLAALPASARELGPLDAFTFAAGLVTASLLFVAVNQLAAQAPGLRATRSPS